MKNKYKTSIISLFNFKIFFFIFFLLLTIFFLYREFIVITDQDRRDYQQMMTNYETIPQSSSPYLVKQHRKGIQKDFFFTEKDHPDRYQLRLIAGKAQLVLDHHDEQTEIIEQMQEVTCYMQEELYYLLPDGKEAVKQPNGKLLLRNSNPNDSSSWVAIDTTIMPMQIIRFLAADNATYFYKSDLFVAHQVSLSRFIVPGHQLVKSISDLQPLMVGVAEEVEFSMGGENLNFKASKLKATFFGEFK